MATENGDGAVVPAASPPQRPRRLRTEMMEHVLVQKAVEVLGAQIVHVDDEFGKSASTRPAGHDSAEEE
jgi:hypothetical protein